MLRAALIVAVLGAVADSARAERRVFVHAFQYGTEAPGVTSAAVWYGEARPRWDGDLTSLDYRLQIQHGLTEHWDAAIYTAFTETAAGDPLRDRPFSLDQVRLQNRYRLVDRSEWPVDLQLQLDLAKQFGPSIYDVELRAVVARDLDSLSIAANVIGLATIGNDTDRELDLGWVASASYEVHPMFNVGVEAFGQVDAELAAIGPVLAVAPSSRLWFAAAAAVGITSAGDDLTVRAILGISL